MRTLRYVLIGTACVLFGATYLAFSQGADWMTPAVGAAFLCAAAGVVGKLMEPA